MAAADALEPPVDVNHEDPGAHQLSEPETSDSEDQFTDAQSAPTTPQLASPVPKTRVEKVDDSPSHGDVPNTAAHQMREADAQPDEIAIKKEPDDDETPNEATLQEVPLTVVQLAASNDGTPKSPPEGFSGVDAKPDIILEPSSDAASNAAADTAEEQADDFGDDFDDFEEGGQEDDFDDFDDGFAQSQPPAAPSPGPQPAEPMILPFTIPDFDGLGPDEILSTAEPCLDSIFPPHELDISIPESLPREASLFLTPRSASLWSQLVAPPPLAPPDWIRSRTRRLFLVSLGVPVDLDEILPASKQKKLVLPSLNLRATSPRTSSDSRSPSHLRQGEGNVSSTSVDTQGKPRGSSKKRKGPPPEPELDLVAARYLCTTTDEALDGMTSEELKEHVSKLEAMQGTANEVLEYWRKRTDEKIGDREAFEGVIENLVKHARKVRK